MDTKSNDEFDKFDRLQEAYHSEVEQSFQEKGGRTMIETNFGSQDAATDDEVFSSSNIKNARSRTLYGKSLLKMDGMSYNEGSPYAADTFNNVNESENKEMREALDAIVAKETQTVQ